MQKNDFYLEAEASIISRFILYFYSRAHCRASLLCLCPKTELCKKFITRSDLYVNSVIPNQIAVTATFGFAEQN